jgi:hypothetical protein
MTLILSGTDGLSDVDGSAATPAIRGTDANTGIFFPAADTIAFAEGGVESMRIDSSGNVGIGTVSPSTYGKFVAYSSGGYGAIDSNGQFDSYQLLDVASAGGRITGYSNQGVLGSVGIEQTTTGSKGGYITFKTCASGTNTQTERARIDSSGRFTLPYQPAFWAYTTNSSATFAATTIIFDSSPTNRGSCYNTSNGRFTAPVAGFYVFGGMLQNNSSSAYLEVEFRVNNAKQNDTQVAQIQSGQKAVMSAAYYLNANDYVTFYVFNGTVLGDYTSAWGYLVG